jgi:hypothetical protein
VARRDGQTPTLSLQLELPLDEVAIEPRVQGRVVLTAATDGRLSTATPALLRGQRHERRASTSTAVGFTTAAGTACAVLGG